MQKKADDKLYSVMFNKYKLIDAEFNYSIHEKELLIMKHMITLWNQYIKNNHIIKIITDHKSLIYLIIIKNFSKWLKRWLDEFQKYSLKFWYQLDKLMMILNVLNYKFDFMRSSHEENQF